MNPPTEVEGMEQNDNDDIDDADWYRQEVGEEPDSGLFSNFQILELV